MTLQTLAFVRAGVKKDAPEVDSYSGTVIEAWNMLGGQLDWAAIPVLAEMFCIDDTELFVRGLIQIRDHLREETAHG